MMVLALLSIGDVIGDDINCKVKGQTREHIKENLTELKYQEICYQSYHIF